MSTPRDLLTARRAELLAQLHGVEAGVSASTANGIGFGKRIGDGTNIAVERITEVAAHANATALLAEVDAALDRVATGVYGRCTQCAGSIETTRLEARPFARTCIACATT